MAARRKAAASPAPANRVAAAVRTLAGVEVGDWATLDDGSEVRVAAKLQGAVFVRYRDYEPRTGPHEMSGSTVVVFTRSPVPSASGSAPVADPLAGCAAGEPTLLRTNIGGDA